MHPGYQSTIHTHIYIQLQLSTINPCMPFFPEKPKSTQADTHPMCESCAQTVIWSQDRTSDRRSASHQHYQLSHIISSAHIINLYRTERSEWYAGTGLSQDHKHVHVSYNQHMNSELSFKVSRIKFGNRVSLPINISCSWLAVAPMPHTWLGKI